MNEDRSDDSRADRSWLARRTIVDPELLDPIRRQANRLPEQEDEPGPVVIELNLFHERGLSGAEARLLELYNSIVDLQPPRAAPLQVTDGYWRYQLSIMDTRQLVALDRQTNRNQRAIHHVWMDYLVSRLVDRSSRTVKADAARRLFSADGREVVWAVLDSGIDSSHPHFRSFDTLGGEIADLHRSFTSASTDTGTSDPLKDPYGHGTHVAGIIAGGFPPSGAPDSVPRILVAEHVALTSALATEHNTFDLERMRQHDPHLVRTSAWEDLEERDIREPSRLSGIAPYCRLISLQVLNGHGTGRSSDVIRAMRYVRKELNDDGRQLRVHGVNLSLGYDFNARSFACGQTPICVEVDRLVRSGVVVVAAAGNTGHGIVNLQTGTREANFLSTINDPGNAALAITVGSTHRDMPHLYGVSYFSSKGPTADGRLKPDLLAPGERITSCAAGRRRQELDQFFNLDAASSEHVACYVDDTGTSMAAPHVSGVIAAFLSIRREFIGRPEEIKRIFVKSATSLGRERYFEGQGLVNLMRAIQFV